MWFALYFCWTALQWDISSVSALMAMSTHTEPREYLQPRVCTVGYLYNGELTSWAPQGSSWPLAQGLVIRKRAPGEQASWFVGISLFPGNDAHQTALPDSAVETQAPPLPQALTHLQALGTGPPFILSGHICCWRGISQGPTGPSP